MSTAGLSHDGCGMKSFPWVSSESAEACGAWSVLRVHQNRKIALLRAARDNRHGRSNRFCQTFYRRAVSAVLTRLRVLQVDPWEAAGRLRTTGKAIAACSTYQGRQE